MKNRICLAALASLAGVGCASREPMYFEPVEIQAQRQAPDAKALDPIFDATWRPQTCVIAQLRKTGTGVTSVGLRCGMVAETISGDKVHRIGLSSEQLSAL